MERKCKSFSYLCSAYCLAGVCTMTSVLLCFHDRSNEEIVRPRVPLEACLASFSGAHEVPDFYSTALNSKTTAIKYVYLEISFQ
jgi:hypothetical protein